MKNLDSVWLFFFSLLLNVLVAVSHVKMPVSPNWS